MMIVKIGGGREINLRGIVSDLAEIQESMLIIHGANAVRDKLAESLGKPKQILTSVSGFSSVFSDDDALDVMMMAYSGLMNKRIVEWCQRCKINAVGLSGIDGRIIRGRRNRGIRIRDGEKVRIVRDLSGKPRFVNVFLFRLLMNNGFVPVLTVPILDEYGTAMNTENDEIVCLLQSVLHARMIIQLIEAPGLLSDPKNPKSLLSRVTPEEIPSLMEKTNGRMKRKLLALSRLFTNDAPRVLIADGRTEHPIRDALDGKGTVVIAS